MTMLESSYSLVFKGEIEPDQDLAEVKKRLQKVFNKNAHTIEKLFSGRKVKLKQGLKKEQAEQYKAKMLSIGVLCEIEAPASTAQTSQPQVSQNSDLPISTPKPHNPFTSRDPMDSVPSSNSAGEEKDSKPNAAMLGSPMVANVTSTPTLTNGKTIKIAEIDKAFIGNVPKVELPATYKAGVIAMGVTMVLLPLLYIGLIGLIGYGLLGHAIGNTGWLDSLGAKMGSIAYVTPIIAGLTVILFMIKPLFAAPAKKSPTITLDPIKEPVLFHFVNKVALAVGAPRPKQIDVDCEVNASASFRKGLFSFFGDDLVLTIGMPLLAGFNTRQLAGVLAHEFGHFSQGVGMRFHYLSYKINSWFYYSVYARDSWDEKLEEFAEGSDNWISIVLNVARGGVWLTRKLLFVFMTAGQLVSSYMLRQMEFDADRYEAQVAGSEQFKNTTLELQRLALGYQVSHDYLAQAWEDKKLVNDFPSLVSHNASKLPQELDQSLLSQIENSETKIYDSHPGDKERIANAAKQQARGIVSLNISSADLFKRFDLLAKEVSQLYYAHVLGLDFDASKLVDINQVVKIAQDNEKQQEAYHLYFKDMAPVFELPLSVNIFDTSKADWGDLLEKYKTVNNQLADEISRRLPLMKQTNEAFVSYQQFTAISDLDQAGFILFPEWFDLTAEALEAYKKHMAASEQAWKQSLAQLKPMFEVNDARMSIALTLLNHPKILDANPEHAQHLKTRNRLSLLINNIKRNTNAIVEYSFKHNRLWALLSCSPVIGQKPAELVEVTNKLLEELKQSNQQLVTALNRLDYPYVAEGEHQTIADYLEQFMPRANQFSNESEFYIASGKIMLEKLEAIYGRVISGLANVALTVDRLIPVIEGKAPMPEQVVEQVQQPVQQQVEYARAAGAEEFTAKASDSPQVEFKKPDVKEPESPKPESPKSELSKPELSKPELPKPEAAEVMVKESKTVQVATQQPPVEKAPEVEKPVINVKEIKDAGIASTFAIDDTPPEELQKAEANKQESQPVDAKPEMTKAEKTKTEVAKPVVAENKDAGVASSFAIDETSPEVKAEPAQKEPQPEMESTINLVAEEIEEPKVVAKENNDAGVAASFSIGETSPEVKAEPARKESQPEMESTINLVVEEIEEPKVVAKENNDAGVAASFSIDEAPPETGSTQVATIATAGSTAEPTIVEARENNDAGKTASFVVDESEPEEDTAQQLAEPLVPAKSSNPFLQRSAFAPKQEATPSVSANASVDANAEKDNEENPPGQPADPVVPKGVNPFLANISTYKDKLADGKAEGQTVEKDNGSTISMDALNPGSSPTMAATSENSSEENAGAIKEQESSVAKEKMASFSTGGLSLEPAASEDGNSAARVNANAESVVPDPESVVVEKPVVLNSVNNVDDETESNSQDIAQNNQQDGESQKFFESPGLPNGCPAGERGLRPEPPTDLFGTSETGSDSADSAKHDSGDGDTNPAVDPPNRH